MQAVFLRSGLGGLVRPDSVTWRRLGLRCTRTTHQDKMCRSSQDTSFLRFSVKTHMSRHIVVAPIPSAPLLTDTRRSTVGPGTREDVVPNSFGDRSTSVYGGAHRTVSAVVAALVSARCSSGALAHMERRCELEVRRGWCCWTCVASSWSARLSRIWPERRCPCWRHSRCVPAAKVFAKVEMHAASCRRWKSTYSSSAWFAPSSWDSFLRSMRIRGTRWCVSLVV